MGKYVFHDWFLKPYASINLNNVAVTGVCV